MTEREMREHESLTAAEGLAARVINGTATRADVNWLANANEMLANLASPTPGCACETCSAIRRARPELARATSKFPRLRS